MSAPVKFVLVADVPGGIKTLRNVLDKEVKMVAASTLTEAQSLLDSAPDLIVCGIHFDDSRMFDLLRLSKADPVTRDIPFLCFRDMDSSLTPPILESLQIACTALGAIGFVDLFDLKSKHGTNRADERFRQVIREQLADRKL